MITQGGFYIGDFTYSNGETCGLIVSEKKYEIRGQWTKSFFKTITSDDDGYLNTILMNSRNDSLIAKHVLSLNINGYGDWYIPSRNELKFIYQNRDKLPNDYEFSPNWYWSSTQNSINTLNAWLRAFNFDDEDFTYNHFIYYVRAIRRFVL